MLGLLALSACAPPPGLEAKVWTVEDFLRLAPQQKDLGGWRADQLVTFEGAPIPFRSPPYWPAEVPQGPGYGLTVFPAFAQGEPASFIITEIWFAHPTPWIQPAWIMVSALAPDFPQVPGTRSLFPVGTDGSFYSPFWRIEYVLAPDATPDRYTSAKAVLDANLPDHEGPVVYCPIVPVDGGVVRAAGEATPVHPWVLQSDVGLDGGAPMPVKAPTNRVAWVDGKEKPYLGIGVGRIEDYGQLPEENPLYTFAVPSTDGGRELLPIPAVLSDEPFATSFVRRVDVLLPSAAAVFVPVNRPELAALLSEKGARFVSPPVDDVTARTRLGAVIRDTACLATDAGFASCTLLDSPAAIDPLGDAYVIPTNTTLAIDVVQAGGRLP
jgi:hypothetical protein